MICPQCNTYTESNFCPNCGKKLKLVPKTRGQMQYSEYRRYYPDKWAAISALRRDTGLGFSEANRIINNLFGMTDDDEIKKADAEHERLYQAQEQQKAELHAGAKRTAKRAGVVAGVGLYAVIKSILNLTKEYE